MDNEESYLVTRETLKDLPEYLSVLIDVPTEAPFPSVFEAYRVGEKMIAANHVKGEFSFSEVEAWMHMPKTLTTKPENRAAQNNSDSEMDFPTIDVELRICKDMSPVPIGNAIYTDGMYRADWCAKKWNGEGTWQMATGFPLRVSRSDFVHCVMKQIETQALSLMEN